MLRGELQGGDFFPSCGIYTTMIVHLLPFGEVEGGLLLHLAEELPKVVEVSVKIEVPLLFPRNSYHRWRKQYLADPFLEVLPQGGVGIRYVGLVDEDLYVPGLNFVFGVADPDRGRAIVALARLRQDFYGLEPDKELFYERSLKEVVHELGHTWGLPHCPDPRCIMHFSNSLYDTDRKGTQFCERCRQKLAHFL